ncbi:MAG: tetratricopeptide repeat protein [Bacteroidota bacterium]
MKYNILITVFILLGQFSVAQKENALLRQGNRDYDKGNFKEAEKGYRKALEVNKESVKGQFNLGAAVYKNNNYAESAKIYANLAGNNVDRETRSKVFHNLGNSLMQSKDYEKSILAYKNALMNDPKNKDTKYNLEYAKMMLKKQQQQHQQQKKDDKDKKDDKKDQKDKKDQNKDQDKKQDQQKQPQDQKKISKEDADRMLEALKNDEKKTMQKVKKQKAKVQVTGIEKDW